MSRLASLRAMVDRVQARLAGSMEGLRAFFEAYWETISTFNPAQIPQCEHRPARSVANAQCLAPFLKALNYRGGQLNVFEAAPHFRTGMDIADLRAALVNLGFKTEVRKAAALDIDPRLMPCLHESEETGEVMVLLGAVDGVIFAHIAGHRRALSEEEKLAPGRAYFAQPLDVKSASDKRSWSTALVRRFDSFIWQLAALSALSNLLSLAAPLFVMVVYDRVIALRALDVLPMLFLGLAAAVGVDLWLRTLRARLLGALAGRIDHLIGASTFAKLLRLPLSYTESAPISAQIARLREFQAVRDLFSGPTATAIVDFPFTLIALVAVAVIAGWLVLVPLAACVVFAAAGFLGARWLQRHERAQSASATRLFNHVTDTTLHHESIKREGGEDVWSHRFRLMSAEAATRTAALNDRAAAVEALSGSLNTLAALAVLAFGTLLALNGAITVGALIATMALTWRILSPAQHLFQTLARLGRLRASIQAMNQMLRITDEYDANMPNLARPPRHGRVALSRVSLRYGKDSEPALTNLNLTIPARGMVALTGPNGAGKSSVLRVIQGLYQPQAGVVAIDGVDIRQISPKLLRRAIACAPQKIDLFYGTIAQNLRLADALASDETLRRAADEAGVLEAILSLPEGFNARIGDAATQNLPSGFLRSIVIARALVRDAPILLLDEPEAMLDDDGARAVQRLLERLRGVRTVLIATHRPSFVRVADFAVFLRAGLVEFGGKPDGAIERLLGPVKSGRAA